MTTLIAAMCWFDPRHGARSCVRAAGRGSLDGNTENPPGSTPLPRNLSFDELREKDERFLPAEIASLWWNGLGYFSG